MDLQRSAQVANIGSLVLGVIMAFVQFGSQVFGSGNLLFKVLQQKRSSMIFFKMTHYPRFLRRAFPTSEVVNCS